MKDNSFTKIVGEDFLNGQNSSWADVRAGHYYDTEYQFSPKKAKELLAGELADNLPVPEIGSETYHLIMNEVTARIDFEAIAGKLLEKVNELRANES